MVEDAKRIVLNVGGVLYETTHSTIKKSEYFNSLLQNDPALDFLFVDRDGSFFYILLNFLRTNELYCAYDETVYRILAKEAEFFGINELLPALDGHTHLPSGDKRRDDKY